MSSVEAGKLSYIRASREVVPSQSLRLFLKSANQLMEDENFDILKDGSVEPIVYAASSLRFTLFERRAQAGEKVNGLLRKVDNYIQAPLHYSTRTTRTRPGVPPSRVRVSRENPLPTFLRDAEEMYVADEARLYVPASTIVDCTKSDFKHLGTELALVADSGSVAEMLEAQSGFIRAHANSTNASKGIPRPAEYDTPTQLPFMRAPFASEDDRDEFIDTLKAELPVYDIGIGPITYTNKIIPV